MGVASEAGAGPRYQRPGRLAQEGPRPRGSRRTRRRTLGEGKGRHEGAAGAWKASWVRSEGEGCLCPRVSGRPSGPPPKPTFVEV